MQQPTVPTVSSPAHQAPSRDPVRAKAGEGDRGAKRDFDVVILGATGFVGRLILEELTCDYMVRLYEGR